MHDTTVRLKYTLTAHPTLTTAAALSDLLSPFGEIDTASIVLSLKPPKKAPHKPPKHGTALVPFKKIGDAFSAVCASGKPAHGLDGIDVGWVEGKEPEILGWLKKLGKLGTPVPTPVPDSRPAVPEADREAPPPQERTKSDLSSPFSTFPESIVSQI